MLSKRGPNFSNMEKNELMKIIANRYGQVLEDKKTDRASTALKEKAWLDIETEYNASSLSNTYRSAVCLKKCYKNRKKELRKMLAEEKKEVMMTGGGPPPTPKGFRTGSMMMAMKHKLLGDEIRGFEFIVDTGDNSLLGMDQNTEVGEVLQLQVGDTSNQNTSWAKHTPILLKKPISKALTSTEKEQANNADGKKEEQVKNNTPKRSSPRRPTTTIKAMTFSDVAKKYDLLLGKRLALVDNQLKHGEIQNALDIKKRQLEIEILEIELQSKKANANWV